MVDFKNLHCTVIIEFMKCFPHFIFQTFTANVVISGAGALHVPVTPDFKGKGSFKGDAFHSSHWKKGYDTTGKRVAVIGTGASAVQIVPSIAPKVWPTCTWFTSFILPMKNQ